jgi:hypothetical protein
MERAMKDLGWSLNADGNVVLTMTQDDWSNLLLTLGYATGAARRGNDVMYQSFLDLVNRLNVGNPRFTPYAVETEKMPHPPVRSMRPL